MQSGNGSHRVSTRNSNGSRQSSQKFPPASSQDHKPQTASVDVLEHFLTSARFRAHHHLLLLALRKAEVSEKRGTRSKCAQTQLEHSRKSVEISMSYTSYDVGETMLRNRRNGYDDMLCHWPFCEHRRCRTCAQTGYSETAGEDTSLCALTRCVQKPITPLPPSNSFVKLAGDFWLSLLPD